jgi:hypothetical protein
MPEQRTSIVIASLPLSLRRKLASVAVCRRTRRLRQRFCSLCLHECRDAPDKPRCYNPAGAVWSLAVAGEAQLIAVHDQEWLVVAAVWLVTIRAPALTHRLVGRVHTGLLAGVAAQADLLH